MAEEKNADSRQQTSPRQGFGGQATGGRINFAKVAVNIYIFNNAEELLLIKSKKYNKFVAPGGKIEEGENISEAINRELREEIGVNENIDFKFLGVSELNTGIIMLNYKAKIINLEISLNEEHIDYSWKKADEWLLNKDLHENVNRVIEKYLINNDSLKNKSADPTPSVKATEVEKALEDKYKRALADYQNLLKQTAKEKQEFALFANEQLLYEILPVYGHLKLALLHSQTSDGNSWLDGVKNVVRQFKDVLKNLGVEEIKTAGEKSDHNIMEAVGDEATDAEKLDGTVAKEVTAGYKLRGKVIMPAKVVVYKVKK